MITMHFLSESDAPRQTKTHILMKHKSTLRRLSRGKIIQATLFKSEREILGELS